MSRKNYMVVL